MDKKKTLLDLANDELRRLRAVLYAFITGQHPACHRVACVYRIFTRSTIEGKDLYRSEITKVFTTPEAAKNYRGANKVDIVVEDDQAWEYARMRCQRDMYKEMSEQASEQVEELEWEMHNDAEYYRDRIDEIVEGKANQIAALEAEIERLSEKDNLTPDRVVRKANGLFANAKADLEQWLDELS